jgi:hypothetical protein
MTPKFGELGPGDDPLEDLAPCHDGEAQHAGRECVPDRQSCDGIDGDA